MPDVTVKAIDEMESIYGGLARRARAELGVTGWGMQVFTLPPHWDGYPNHNHSSDAFDPNQEEVYIRSAAQRLSSRTTASSTCARARWYASARISTAGSSQAPTESVSSRLAAHQAHSRRAHGRSSAPTHPARRPSSVGQQWTSRRSRS